MSRRRGTLLDEATRRMDAALVDITAARTELDCAVETLRRVLTDRRPDGDR